MARFARPCVGADHGLDRPRRCPPWLQRGLHVHGGPSQLLPSLLSNSTPSRPDSFGDFLRRLVGLQPMEADLHQIIRSGQLLSNSHVQYFMYQLFRGLKYIHSAHVLHRDIKPGNVLVNADCEVRSSFLPPPLSRSNHLLRVCGGFAILMLTPNSLTLHSSCSSRSATLVSPVVSTPTPPPPQRPPPVLH